MRRRVLALAVGLALACAGPAFAQGERGTWYLSPKGDDGASGKTAQAPFKTFKTAFLRMKAGDELVLLDGTYSEAAGTGHISYPGPGPGAGGKHSDQVPSGPDEARPTVVRAQNPGNVRVEGALFVGRSFRKDRNIVIDGLTFEGGGALYNTQHVTLRNCGFHGPLMVGTNDHDQGNERNLIEDVWVWASGQRIIAINYRALKNVWRRVVVRGDGCGRRECQGSGNPNVGITVYDSSDVSMQNIIVVDRILAPNDSPYADFAVAQHTPGAWLFGRNEWLGTISLKAPDQGYYFEPDETIDPTIRISNAIAWDSPGSGFNLARAGTNIRLENLTTRSIHYDGIRVASELTSGQIANALVAGAGRYGINAALRSTHVNVHGAKGAYNQSKCADGCFDKDPRGGKDPALRYLVRIEEGSPLKGAGVRGADIGANVVLRYGREGTRFGDEGYNILTNAPLWPWPNEARIKAEMCADERTRRGFCNAPSLTRYIWDYLGNKMPDDPYGIGRRQAK